MPSSHLSRRAFLAAAGGLVVLAACGSDDGDDAGGGSGTTIRTDEESNLSALLVSNDLYATDRPQRFAFTLADRDGDAAGPPASIRFLDGTVDDAEMEAPLFADGLPPGRGLYVVQPVFPTAGIFEAVVTVEGAQLPLAYQIFEEPEARVPGDQAPVVPSATFADPRGVDPICTLEPECPYHELDLADLIGAGAPVVVSFSTPARCQTQYCGPTLEQLVELRDEFADLAIVHVEIYQGATTNELAEPVAAFRLPSEPWMYALDGAGVITDRMGGAFDVSETRRFLQRARG